MSRFAVGVICALVGATCWGFSGTCMQFLFSNYDVPVLFVATFRLLVAGAVLTLAMFVTKRDQMIELLHDRSSMLRTCLFGLLGLFFCQVAYMFAIDYTNAGTATVLQSFNVVIVLVYTCISARRAPSASECLAVCLAIFATVLIATKGDFSTLSIPLAGLLWGLASAAAVAFYVCYPKPLFKKYSSPPVTGLGMLFGGAAAAVLLVISELTGTIGGSDFSWVSQIDGTAILFLLIAALVGTLLSFTLYLYGVSIVGSVKGSLLGTVEPASASIIAALWLKTAFTWADWLGMVLMIATVFIVSLQPKRDGDVPEKDGEPGTAG